MSPSLLPSAESQEEEERKPLRPQSSILPIQPAPSPALVLNRHSGISPSIHRPGDYHSVTPAFALRIAHARPCATAPCPTSEALAAAVRLLSVLATSTSNKVSCVARLLIPLRGRERTHGRGGGAPATRSAGSAHGAS